MNIRNPFWPKHAFVFKGGGGPSPADAPAPTPPVTERSTEVEAASVQSRKDAMRRKGYRSTLLAGETGGFQDQTQRKTLLGS